MGGKKRKASSGPVKKESKYKIPRRFDCPICDAKSSIAVKVLNREGHKEALIKCRHCGVGAHDPPRAMLPLEKAVDAFFGFREELMEKDRAYLDRHGLDIGGVTNAVPAAADVQNIGSGNVMYPSAGGAGGAAAGAAAAAAATAPAVRNLAELERAMYGGGRLSAGEEGYAATSKARAGGAREDEDDSDAIAAQYFAPRRDAESEDDEYDAMFS